VPEEAPGDQTLPGSEDSWLVVVKLKEMFIPELPSLGARVSW
jgi:hypothetical protein